MLNAGTQTLSVTFTPTDATNYATATATVSLTVLKATPTITWTSPVDIVYGTALGATQLNATASVDGTFVYTPAAGASLNAGSHSLSVTFTPTDSANYATATATVPLTVKQAAPVLTLTGAHVEYDTHPHAATGTATGIGGAAVAGLVRVHLHAWRRRAAVNAGSYSVTPTFTSSDPNYSGASGTTTVTIDQADAGSDVGHPGRHRLRNAARGHSAQCACGYRGHVCLHAAGRHRASGGHGHVLSMTFTPADPNYRAYTETVSINVLKATPVVTWTAPARHCRRDGARRRRN